MRASLLGLGHEDGNVEEEDAGDLTYFDENLAAVMEQEKKSNRRTSSMMARQELSSQEQLTFSEFARNPSAGHGSFRARGGYGASFGTGSGRESFGRSRLSGRMSTPGSTLRLNDVDEMTPIDSAGDDTLLDFLSLEDDPNRHDMNFHGPRHELTLTHLKSIPFSERPSSHHLELPEPPETDLSVFVQARPWRHTSSQWKQRNISIFLWYSDSKVLAEVVCRLAARAHGKPEASSLGQKSTARIRTWPDDVRLYLHEGATGVCLLRQAHSRRLVTLSSNSQQTMLSLDVYPDSGLQIDARFLSLPISQIGPDVSLRSLSGSRLCLQDLHAPHQQYELHWEPHSDAVAAMLAICQHALDCVSHNVPLLKDLWLGRLAARNRVDREDEATALFETLSMVVLMALKLETKDPPGSVAGSTDDVWEEPHNHHVHPWAWAASKTSERQSTMVHRHDDSLVASAMYRVQSQLLLSNGRDKMTELLDLALFHSDSQKSRPARAAVILTALLTALHLWHQEQLLNITSDRCQVRNADEFISRVSHLAGWSGWSLSGERPIFGLGQSGLEKNQPTWKPQGVQQFIDDRSKQRAAAQLPLFRQVSTNRAPAGGRSSELDSLLEEIVRALTSHTPRIDGVVQFLSAPKSKVKNDDSPLTKLLQYHVSPAMLETLPEAVASHIKDWLKLAQTFPRVAIDKPAMELLDRPDLAMLQETNRPSPASDLDLGLPEDVTYAARTCEDMRNASEVVIKPSGFLRRSKDESPVTMRLIYRMDRRWQEATKLLNPLRVAVTTIFPKDDWTEAQFLEAQKALAELVYKRTMAIPSGQAALKYSSHQPLLTERIEIKPFNTTCNMQPSNNTVNADKSNFTEEKVSWAFFHAGVNAGLRVSKEASKVDNSWLILNKPTELGNRHAGFLYALGLNGHLKHMAKWLAFKYLTPKHNMTSIGLLLGLSASYMGTRDSLVTRLLSVHVTRLLPPGAAELNLSPLTQTAGVIGIGLLYYGSQHRRMSEILLSELECVTDENSNDSPNSFRDEGYRLAAGFALGLINLGTGRDSRSLEDMRLVERLRAIAVGSRTIESIHVLDRSTTGSIMACAMIFMKSENERIARDIAVPKTQRHFEHIRPDVLLLRTVASNLIMWSEIKPTVSWIKSKLPSALSEGKICSAASLLNADGALDNRKLPLYNVLAGLCWSMSLKCAGGNAGCEQALQLFFELFDRIRDILEVRAAEALTWDEHLARDSLLRFQYVLALSMATVAAGTGDLQVFRRLRYLHACITDEQTFGLHQASHTAMGALFLGHGKYTFSTSDLAIASLLCAFYPLFPKDVLDNRAHLQALRHLWVYATEPRCLVPRDVDTNEVMTIPITVRLKTGEDKHMTIPGLLPELASIAQLHTASPQCWPVQLDFAANHAHLAAFKKHQTIYLRRKGLLDQHASLLAATLSCPPLPPPLADFAWLFRLPEMRDAGVAAAHAADVLHTAPGDGLARPPTPAALVQSVLDAKTTALDDALVLAGDVWAGDGETLRALRSVVADGGAGRWIRPEWREALRLAVMRRVVREQGDARDGDVDME